MNGTLNSRSSPRNVGHWRSKVWDSPNKIFSTPNSTSYSEGLGLVAPTPQVGASVIWVSVTKSLRTLQYFIILAFSNIKHWKAQRAKSKKKKKYLQVIFSTLGSLLEDLPSSLLNSKMKSEAPGPQTLAFFWMSHHLFTLAVTGLYMLGNMSSPLICLGRSLYLLRDHIYPSALTMLLLSLLLLFLYCPSAILPILAHQHNLLTTKIRNM